MVEPEKPGSRVGGVSREGEGRYWEGLQLDSKKKAKE